MVLLHMYMYTSTASVMAMLQYKVCLEHQKYIIPMHVWCALHSINKCEVHTTYTCENWLYIVFLPLGSQLSFIFTVCNNGITSIILVSGLPFSYSQITTF